MNGQGEKGAATEPAARSVPTPDENPLVVRIMALLADGDGGPHFTEPLAPILYDAKLLDEPGRLLFARDIVALGFSIEKTSGPSPASRDLMQLLASFMPALASILSQSGGWQKARHELKRQQDALENPLNQVLRNSSSTTGVGLRRATDPGRDSSEVILRRKQ